MAGAGDRFENHQETPDGTRRRSRCTPAGAGRFRRAADGRWLDATVPR
ncbi:Hypothetical protein I596_1170 [Dokdonella koreensis DS-123]|uniref:Uncharacterized protein n=1 Tax=Dokdonella koreensis DS-123 TaxID=1300342 RepID=A0A160DTB2_9GAMM|nr:Hypothetical protein I596_1170 [Dokdonella koreensis DS-123]